jgi:diguanylate cyclase (GGDEF)-like protein/PAS domain S-box-containing protein
MDLNNRELPLQASLLMLLAGSLVLGGGGLLLDLLAPFPLPPPLNISREGEVAIVLISGGLIAVVRDSRRWRCFAASLMVLFAGYSLAHPLLASADDTGLSWLTGHSRLPPTAAVVTLLVALCCLTGLATPRRRRLWHLVGGVSLAVGLLAILSQLSPATAWQDIRITRGFSLSGGLFCLALGAGLLIISHARTRPLLALPRSAIAVGVTGVLLSTTMWFLGSWAQHHNRLAEADTLVGNLALTLEKAADSRAELILRMAYRWQAAGGLPSLAVRNEEARNYFHDEPSLQALAFLDGQQRSRWRHGREPEALRWLMERQVEPDTLEWLRQFDQGSADIAWRLPDPAAPQMALVAVRAAGSSDQYMLAALDLGVLIHRQLHQDTGDFTVSITRPGQLQIATLAPQIPQQAGTLEPFASDVARVAHGPEFRLTAKTGPPAFPALYSMLPIGAGLLGLLFSYQLIIGRALMVIRNQQAKALRISEQRFRSLFTQNPNAVFALSPEGTFHSINPVARDFIGAEERTLRGQHFRHIVHEATASPGDVQRLDAAFRRASAGRPQSLAMRYRRQGLHPRDLEVSLLPIKVDGGVSGVFGIAKDMTQRVADEERLRILERSLEASSNAVIISDARQPGQPVVYVNPAFTRITGYPAEEALGLTSGFLSGPDTDPDDSASIQAARVEGRPLSLTMRAYRRDGTRFWNQIFLSPVRDGDKRVSHFVAIMNDISEHKEQGNQLAYQATHDVLTGLANRSLFSDHLAHDVALARRHGQILAVLFIDLDEFKPINDTLGHKVGDQLLISVARRLGHALRPSDTLARFGGDEFVLLLPDLEQADEAETIAERLLVELTRPHRVDGHELHISASIGIALIDDSLQDPEKLIQQADMAMYKAKQQGRNTCQRFTDDLGNRLSERVTLRNHLQEAIDSDQLQLHYQPLLDAAGAIDGLEALVRWQHPLKGAISPADFIPLAEETGQIIALSHWVMTRACRDARALVDSGLLKGRMAINLSPMQFHRPHFLATLSQVLDETGLPAGHLELELTESILMKDADGAIEILSALTGMGVSTAIDDFGTGYSSLSYLRFLPIDKIKIDRSFVQDVITSDKDAALCQGVITLAKELNLRVVAEGIETPEQHDYLKRQGCEVFQGFLFARPMPMEQLYAWLQGYQDVGMDDTQ